MGISNTSGGGHAVNALLSLSAILSASLFFPASACAEGTAGAEAYYPLQKGNVWTYRFGKDNGTARYDVIGYSGESGAYVVRYDMKTIDVVIRTESLIKAGGGRVLRIGGTDMLSGNPRRIYGNKEIILQSPLRPRAQWSYKRDNPGGMDCRVDCKVLRLADCEVPAGRFKNVLVLRRTTTFLEGGKEKSHEARATSTTLQAWERYARTSLRATGRTRITPGWSCWSTGPRRTPPGIDIPYPMHRRGLL